MTSIIIIIIVVVSFSVLHTGVAGGDRWGVGAGGRAVLHTDVAGGVRWEVRWGVGVGAVVSLDPPLRVAESPR